MLEMNEVLGDVFYSAAMLDGPFYVDNLLKTWINEISSPALDVFFRAITHLGSPAAFILLAFMGLVFLCIKGHIKQGIILDVGLIAGWAAMNFIKVLVGRERPSGEQLTLASGMSFPSGHAMLSVVFYGFIAYLLLLKMPTISARIMAYALVVLVGLIGFSRIYLNVHYASDVAAGFVFGAVILAIMIRISRGKSSKSAK